MTSLLIRDTSVMTCTDESVQEHVDVEVEAGRIVGLRPAGRAVPAGTTVIDGAGHTLLPGLLDAHVHMALIGPAGDHGDGSWISHVLRVKGVIEDTLLEGFTTVRDAGGLDPAFARAVDAGQIRGPKIFPSGSVISQIGGHGDLREAHEAVHRGASIPGLVARPEVVNGADEVRRVAREQLRKGATQLKMFTSGGVLSPTDHWTHTQFQFDEVRAAVEVAEAWGTYVLAHCHSASALMQVIEAGVRSIEHGSQVDERIADEMLRRDVWLVPTLQILQIIEADPALTPDQRVDINAIIDGSRNAVRIASAKGVGIGSGSDLVGPDQTGRGLEIVLKAELMGAAKAILSATRDNARLVRMQDTIGTIEAGKQADLVLVAGNPLDDVKLLASGTNIPVVIRAGEIVKDTAGMAHDSDS
ncbi:amidohydrolase family protein [Actinoplanes bogorensis]|uniref:Amidohydrolase family protein n=1 Tax=Paractinoplanes bogorensis TaxID=1610840 RepID=A0ABS5YU28_9ACTN|nr:amidohydrolase family protein [Actinoplanes bogorensis]MBU2666184.1 amidohydrolase family protein [Actinoplanes bogorensis]